jgi:integrase
MAVYTGLRSRELAALKWGDLHLDAVTTFVRVRGSTRKNGKSAEMRLHPELADALRELKGRDMMDEPVFKRIPRIERFRRDLVKARIAPQDRLGRKAVFHSLRHTFGTNLARGGVASRVAMALMVIVIADSPIESTRMKTCSARGVRLFHFPATREPPKS